MERVSLGQCLRFVEVMQLTEVEKIWSVRHFMLLRCLMH